MNERKGARFSIAAENAPVDGCTVSKAVAEAAKTNPAIELKKE